MDDAIIIIFFILLFIRSITLEGAIEGVKFMFVPDWSYFNGKTFFCTWTSILLTKCWRLRNDFVSSYFHEKEAIVSLARKRCDYEYRDFVILAGLVIFPAVFALGLFTNRRTWTSIRYNSGCIRAIAIWWRTFTCVLYFTCYLQRLLHRFHLLEVVVSIGIGKKPIGRKRSSWIFAAIIFIVGIPSALSFGVMSDFTIMEKASLTL